MSRLITPVILLFTAGAVLIYNQRPDRKLVFPLLDLITTDPATQGWLTVAILGTLGGIAAISAGFGIWQSRRSAE